MPSGYSNVLGWMEAMATNLMENDEPAWTMNLRLREILISALERGSSALA
jgi:hypothetical protein